MRCRKDGKTTCECLQQDLAKAFCNRGEHKKIRALIRCNKFSVAHRRTNLDLLTEGTEVFEIIHHTSAYC